MSKKPKVTLAQADQDQGEAQDKRAEVLARQIDAEAAPIIAHLTDLKAEYEGGPFVVMQNVLSNMTDEQIDELPEPHSKTGNNPAWYKIRQVSGKSETVKEVYFYDRTAMSLPSVKAALDEKDKLARSLADPSKVNTADIPELIKNLPIHTRQARINRLSKLVSTAKSNVCSAFELYWQMKAFDALSTVTYSVCFALDENGQECDGKDGRPYKVDETSTPITITTALKSRMGTDTKQIGIGTFKKIDVDKAKEAPGGPTYQALFNTIAKGPDQAQPATGAVAVNTLETFVTRLNDECEYLARAIDTTDKAAWSAIRKLLEKEDTAGNDFFYNLSYFLNAFRADVDNPRAQVRYQKLLNDRAEKVKKTA